MSPGSERRSSSDCEYLRTNPYNPCESPTWALWRSRLLAQVVAYREGRPQFSSPRKPSSPLLPGAWFWGSQRLPTWESGVAGPGPGATSPGPLCQAPFQMPVSAQVRWGFFASYPATPLGLGFGFRVQTGLHSSEEAPASSKLRNQQDVSLPFLRAPRGAQADKADAGRPPTPWPPSLPPFSTGPPRLASPAGPPPPPRCSFHQPRP